MIFRSGGVQRRREQRGKLIGLHDLWVNNNNIEVFGDTVFIAQINRCLPSRSEEKKFILIDRNDKIRNEEGFLCSQAKSQNMLTSKELYIYLFFFTITRKQYTFERQALPHPYYRLIPPAWMGEFHRSILCIRRGKKSATLAASCLSETTENGPFEKQCERRIEKSNNARSVEKRRRNHICYPDEATANNAPSLKTYNKCHTHCHATH